MPVFVVEDKVSYWNLSSLFQSACFSRMISRHLVRHAVVRVKQSQDFLLKKPIKPVQFGVCLLMLSSVNAIAADTDLPKTQTAGEHSADNKEGEQRDSLNLAGNKSSDMQPSRCFVPSPSLSHLPAAPLEEGTRRLTFDELSISEKDKTEVKGNVTLQQAGSILRAGELVIDHRSERVEASGGVSVVSDSALFEAESLIQNDASGEVTLENGEFQLATSGAQGGAEKIKVSPGESVELKDLTYSTCKKGEEDWQLAMSELKVDHEVGRGSAHHTTLRVKGVPVFYWPYLSFPTDDRRQSGLLFPSISNDDKNGLDYSQPVYWNIASNFDATITPRWMEKRGLQLGNEFRWLTESTYSEWSTEFLENDKVVEALRESGSDTSLMNSDLSRWHSDFKHAASFGADWSLAISSKRVSDSDYFNDFGSGLESSTQTSLKNQAELAYEGERWQFSTFAQADQSLIGKDNYRVLPRVKLNGADSWGSVRWEVKSNWTRFEHPLASKITGSRFHFAPSISLPLEEPGYFVKPKLSYAMTRFSQESELTFEKQVIERKLPIFSFDTGIHLEKVIGSSKKTVHKISPRIFYVYIPQENQAEINLFDSRLPQFGFSQLWQENRFSSIDRIGDANQASLAIGNQFSDLDSGHNWLEFNLGRRFYFDNQETHLNGDYLVETENSPWLAQAKWQPAKGISFAGFMEWEEETSNRIQSTLSMKIEPKANHIVNLSHRYREFSSRVVEETDLSFAWPINSEWRVVGRWYNDLTLDRPIESLFGVEYESCCWAIRLVAQEYLNVQLGSNGLPLVSGEEDYTKGVHLQFVFKGLGSAGKSGLGNLLSSSIAGYRDRLKN
ncbi:LPS-assembly protein LptD [Aliikangiella sp. G2MR2-5]|uniref:LPS-assembly protein LptD n=1 Tax=Aliikangiella sp. G2MR2-5 TaxID=2788943 RepID=UPI0018A8F5BC|nr:LPS-assembly protein LptD [Aliikangiella sp. G2MR2-5]